MEGRGKTWVFSLSGNWREERSKVCSWGGGTPNSTLLGGMTLFIAYVCS